MALRAVKEAEEHNESRVDFTRQCSKSPVTTSAVLHCVYLAWKHPRRRIKVTFQVNRPAFPPLIRPCVRSKRLRSTMNRTLTSPDSVVSPQSQRAQFSIAVYCLEAPTPPDQGDISGHSTCFSTTNTALRESKRLRSAMNRTMTSPDSVVSPQSQRAQF